MDLYGKLLAFLTGGQSDFPWKLNTTWHGVDVGLALELIILVACLAAGFCLCETLLTSSRRRGVAAFLGVLLFATAAYAASSTLGNLSAGGAISAGDLFYDVQSVGSGGVKVTGTQLKTFFVPTAPVTPSGTLTAGDIVCGGGTTVVQDCGNVTNGGTIPSSLLFTGNITYSGSYTTAQTWLTLNGVTGRTLSGTAGTPGGDGFIAPFSFLVTSDSVDTTTSGNGNLILMSVHDQPAAGFTGGRTAIQGALNISGTSGNITSAGLVGVQSITGISANQGGTTGAYANYKGSAFGSGANVFTATGATFLSLLNSQENDVSLVSGSSSAEKHALTIILGSLDAVQAVYDDSGIAFGAQTNGSAVGWKNGINFGQYAHQWPFTSSSTLIGIQNQVVPSPASSPANIGVDMTNGTFTTAQYKGTGFSVDPSGNTTGNSFIAGANGSTSAMAVRASANAGSGLYYPNSNQVALCGNTSCGLTVNGAGLVTIPLGINLAGSSIIEAVRSAATTTVTASATGDYFLCLDPTSNAINVALPASPATGLTYLIKDCTGKAATHTITVTPNAGNIDGSGTTTLTTNFQSIAITYTGAQWSIN